MVYFKNSFVVPRVAVFYLDVINHMLTLYDIRR